MNTTLIRKIDRLLAEWDKPDTPGIAIAIVLDGKIVYKRGYGLASLEHNVPISTATVFDIGSASKQFVAVCIALLVKRGKLSLKDEVQKYIVEMPRYARPVTIDNLIHHTSGIRDYLTLMDLAGMRFENEYPDQEIIGLIAKQKELNFAPGEEFLYSNSGYLLLGEIVKRVTGASLHDFAEKNIFSPLGMTHTHFNDDFTMVVKNKATGYSPHESGFKVAMSNFDVVGDGGVNTTVEDLFLWDRNFYRNRLAGGGQALIDTITAPGELNDGAKLDYAYGLFVNSYRGMKMVSHGGAWAGYRADLLRFPHKNFSVICLSNLSQVNPTRIAKQITDICLAGGCDVEESAAHHVAIRRGRLSLKKLRERAGFYFNPATGSVVEIILKSGKLVFWNGWTTSPLITSGLDHFSSATASVSVKFEEQSHGGKFQAIITRATGKPEAYEQERQVSVGSAALKSFDGNYHCEELDSTYRITAVKGELWLGRKNTERERLRPVRADLFSGTGLTVRFVINRSGKCSGFELGAGRVKNLLFCRVAQR